MYTGDFHRARARKNIPAKSRADDERLREELRHADIGKLKKLMAPLIERNQSDDKKPHSRKK